MLALLAPPPAFHSPQQRRRGGAKLGGHQARPGHGRGAASLGRPAAQPHGALSLAGHSLQPCTEASVSSPSHRDCMTTTPKHKCPLFQPLPPPPTTTTTIFLCAPSPPLLGVAVHPGQPRGAALYAARAAANLRGPAAGSAGAAGTAGAAGAARAPRAEEAANVNADAEASGLWAASCGRTLCKAPALAAYYMLQRRGALAAARSPSGCYAR